MYRAVISNVRQLRKRGLESLGDVSVGVDDAVAPETLREVGEQLRTPLGLVCAPREPEALAVLPLMGRRRARCFGALTPKAEGCQARSVHLDLREWPHWLAGFAFVCIVMAIRNALRPPIPALWVPAPKRKKREQREQSFDDPDWFA